MTDPSDNSSSDYKHHDGTPGSAADRSAKAAMPDSFPASDPVATTPAVGVRAMALAEMQPDESKLDIVDPATSTARFPDHVTAKLAIEKLVRDIPLDRRCTDLVEFAGGFVLSVTASRPDRERIQEILREGGGTLQG